MSTFSISTTSSVDLNEQMKALAQRKNQEMEQMEKTSSEREARIDQMESKTIEKKQMAEKAQQAGSGKIDIYA